MNKFRGNGIIQTVQIIGIKEITEFKSLLIMYYDLVVILVAITCCSESLKS